MEEMMAFLDKNADAWEIYFSSSETKSVSVERGRIKMVEGSKETSYAVRVIVNGRVGFATASKPSVELCRRALKVARISEERLREFPVGRKAKVEGIYDRRLENITSEWLIDSAERLINSALEVGDVNPAQGYVEVAVEEVRLVNSNGTDLEERMTSCEAYLECVVGDSNAFEFDQSRTAKLDVDFVGRKSAELALESLKAEKIDEGVYDIVLSPIAVHELLSHTLYPAMSSENVMKGRSPLVEPGKNYLGSLTIIDDGSVPYGMCSFSFDDEGVEAKETVVFEEGVLRSYITDFRHALEMGVEPTGNGLRGEDLYPTTNPSNVILEFEDMGDIGDDALFIHALIGAHTSNPVSGDFSLECMNAFLNGRAVRSAMIYGNVYDLLKNIVAFGKDVRQIENTITPSIRFGGVKVNV